MNPDVALRRALLAAEAANDRSILRLVPTKEAQQGPLHGWPMVIKDCVDIAGVPSTNGTTFLTTPASKDAVLVQRLRDAGAIIFAKTNMHEFGIQPTGINPHHGTPVNPWDPGRIPGGSSSGSAVAVATGVSRAAIGTDAGGSIRIPAAVNGVVGLKPTFGAVPLDGVAGLTVDLDHAGPIARTVEDATLVFEVIAARSIDRSVSLKRTALLSGLFDGADDVIVKAVKRAAAEVFPDAREVASPFCEWAAAVEFVIVGTDAQRTCARYLTDHSDDIAPDTLIILRLGAGISTADRKRADDVRVAMRRELDKLLEDHDVLIAPATGMHAPKLHATARKTGELDTAKIARLAGQSFVTNLTGHPSITVPCVRDGLPIGMQLIGRHGDEDRVLAAARMVERIFGTRTPPRFFG
jgi:Asp-tRNA(Asn)/Glu-tRNA(Gln) amidotransferase A subunit family amidase